MWVSENMIIFLSSSSRTSSGLRCCVVWECRRKENMNVKIFPSLNTTRSACVNPERKGVLPRVRPCGCVGLGREGLRGGGGERERRVKSGGVILRTFRCVPSRACKILRMCVVANGREGRWVKFGGEKGTVREENLGGRRRKGQEGMKGLKMEKKKKRRERL